MPAATIKNRVDISSVNHPNWSSYPNRPFWTKCVRDTIKFEFSTYSFIQFSLSPSHWINGKRFFMHKTKRYEIHIRRWLLRTFERKHTHITDSRIQSVLLFTILCVTFATHFFPSFIPHHVSHSFCPSPPSPFLDFYSFSKISNAK